MEQISVNELKQRLDSGENVHLLDVREDSERAEFNIGGKHIPLGRIQMFELEDLEEWKDKQIVVYCRSGKRSGLATMMLGQAGFEQVLNLEGGMLKWVETYGTQL
ncbi:rhodanese-like domain-containing protein [Arachidicoccus ginsenosidivorans]|jgi:rhodanese-related sulfurtransferase|uniref:Rhodanese-like domain-containing protein n=1 Tax=Arachidicoccus ginsenosidivorans TaxID=496057 RepID=A0A5B8VIF4_9BACT|nr:rhodanese-like domain-containing protein [Arachidicoccus ginsenosidivorans]QEC70973.1 rhodanese-like domain-containing protein [Arachidicoccus ginsenosidivorans]